MEPWQIEQLRRSVAMLPPGHSAGAVSREQALDLFDELARTQAESARYREVVIELRRVLDGLEVDRESR